MPDVAVEDDVGFRQRAAALYELVGDRAQTFEPPIVDQPRDRDPAAVVVLGALRVGEHGPPIAYCERSRTLVSAGRGVRSVAGRVDDEVPFGADGLDVAVATVPQERAQLIRRPPADPMAAQVGGAEDAVGIPDLVAVERVLHLGLVITPYRLLDHERHAVGRPRRAAAYV